MPVRRRVVTRERRVQAELPEWAREGALLQQQLVEVGRWEEASRWLHVYRHVGYTAMDVASFFLHYFASGRRWSLKEFGDRTALLRSQLAALGHRREFPTPSSVSRLLSVVVEDEVRTVGARLLLETTDAAALLRHPAAAVRDTFGEAWHFFDEDATIQAFRERALPQGDDLPAPRRRCDAELARPGYTGRKRGELRCSRGTLQHAGTGLWVAVVLSPERADGAAVLPPLLDGLELACRVGGLPRERAVLRADGGGGNVPWLTTCQQRGVAYLTRWGHYGLLGQAEVKQRLARGPWHRVSSSGSGPQREALELGEVELCAGPQTLDATGSRYEPVRSRMVVSRFAAEKTSSVGQLINGWVYELFATSLPGDAWPAPETVAQYFGRAVEENRFAQEDRELGLDHLFSYHLPGQELACLFGLMVWNLRLTRGFAHHAPPADLQPPTPRLLVEATTGGGEATRLELVAAAPTEAAPTPAAATEVVASSAGKLSAEATRALFDEVAWEPVLTRLGSEWTRAPSGDGLLCPQGSLLPASAVVASRHSGGQSSLRLLASVLACRSCPSRSACARTDSPYFAKTVSVLLTPTQGERLSRLLAETTRGARCEQPKPPGHPPPDARAGEAPESRQRSRIVRAPDETVKPGPFAPSETRLIPTEFRHAFRHASGQLSVAVEVPPMPDRRPRRPLGLALTAAERQRRRRSWHARLLDNDLPSDLEVSVVFSGPERALVAVGLRPAADPIVGAMSLAALPNV